MIHSAPAKIAQKTVQASFHTVNIHVMPESCPGSDAGDPRLFRIDFPRMEIEDGSKLVALIDPAQHPAR